MSAFGTSLSAVEATGAGTAIDLNEMMDVVTMSISYTNTGGSLTALVVDLEGSNDGTNFEVLTTKTFSSAEITALHGAVTVTGKKVRMVRGNITTLTETGTTAVTVKVGG